MAESLTRRASDRHPVLPDIGRPQMAKASVRIPDIDWSAAIGQAIQRAVASIGWSHKQAAAEAKVDGAEFGKWLSGGRRPQLDRLMALPELRGPLVIELCRLVESVRVQTVVTLDRRLA